MQRFLGPNGVVGWWAAELGVGAPSLRLTGIEAGPHALRAGFREEEVGWVDSRHSMARKKTTDSGDPGGLLSGVPVRFGCLISDGSSRSYAS